MNHNEWKRSACPYDCPDACGLLMETDGQSIFRVKGDPKHPVTRGFICNKMQHYEKTIHSPNRILTPLKRSGAKGSGEFVPISWDEAVLEITNRWKEIIGTYGSEAILPYSYAGTEHLINNKCGEAFFHRMGASTLNRGICSMGKTSGLQQIIGTTKGVNPDQIQYSDMIIIWGANVKAISVHLHEQISRARKNGIPVYLIETYESITTSLADHTILIKPGTDAALALTMAHLLHKNQMLDWAFIEKHTSGYEPFIESLSKYSPEWCEKITGIDKTVVEHLSLAYGQAKAPLIVLGSGFSRHGNGVMTSRCIACLPSLVGAFAKKGAGIWGNINTGIAYNAEMVKRPDFMNKPVREFSMNQLGSVLNGIELNADGTKKRILNPPVMALYVYNSNPANVAPNQKAVLSGLMREDLFTVVHERFMTDTAKFADIILPADMSCEHADLVKPYGHFAIQRTQQVIPPPGECKSNWDTFCLLAKAMGYDDDYFKMSEEEMCDLVVNIPNAVRKEWTPEEAKAYQDGEGVLLHLPELPDIGTYDHKIHFYDPSLEHVLPEYIENYGGSYPLKLVVAPAYYTLNSTFTERTDLFDKRGRAVLKMSREDAMARGIADGNIIVAYNDLAEVEIFAEVTQKVPQGTVIAEGVFQLEQSLNELTVNALLSEKLAEDGMGCTLCDNTIEIRKI